MNNMNSDEKLCSYCGEVIKVVAIKCKHCQSILNNTTKDEVIKSDVRTEQISKISKTNNTSLNEKKEKNYLNSSNLILYCIGITLIILLLYMYMEISNKDFFGKPRTDINQSKSSSKSSEIDKQFPIKIVCTGDLTGTSILISETEVLMPNQTFNLITQSGTLRRYIDSNTSQIFVYDIVSGNFNLVDKTGLSLPGLNEMLNKNCKKPNR